MNLIERTEELIREHEAAISRGASKSMEMNKRSLEKLLMRLKARDDE